MYLSLECPGVYQSRWDLFLFLGLDDERVRAQHVMLEVVIRYLTQWLRPLQAANILLVSTLP